MSGRSQAAQHTWSCLFSAQGRRGESFQQSGDALFPLRCPYPKNSTHMHTLLHREKKHFSHTSLFDRVQNGNRSIRKGRKRKPQWPFYLCGKIHMRWRRESMNCTIKVCEWTKKTDGLTIVLPREAVLLRVWRVVWALKKKKKWHARCVEFNAHVQCYTIILYPHLDTVAGSHNHLPFKSNMSECVAVLLATCLPALLRPNLRIPFFFFFFTMARTKNKWGHWSCALRVWWRAQ